VDFRDADMHQADFQNSDLRASLFGGTDLREANFEGALNYVIDVYQNDIKQAKFCRDEAIGLLESLDIELLD